MPGTNDETNLQSQTSAKNDEVYKSLSTTHFRLVLTRNPLPRTTDLKPSALATDGYVDTDRWWFGLSLQRKIIELHGKANT